MKKIIISLIIFLLFSNFGFAWDKCEYIEVSKGYNSIYSLTYSPDWKSFAFKNEKDWKFSIIKDWIEWKKYDKIEKIKYSNNWKIAYIASNEWFHYVIKDWIEIYKSEFYLWNLQYSPNWKSIAFNVKKNWNWWIIIKDWIEINKYEKSYNSAWGNMYSLDWKHYAFSAEKKWKKIIVKDWIEINKYFFQWYPLFSPSWKEFVFIAKNKWKYFIVINWKEWKKYTSRITDIPYFIDSNNYLLHLEENWKTFVEKNGIKSDKYDYWYIQNLTYSKDWKNYAYETINSLWNFVVIKNWKEINKYKESLKPMFSSDWESFSFNVHKDWKNILIKDWKEINKYKRIYSYIYSPYWKSFSFIANKTVYKNIIVKDWKEIDKYENVYSLMYLPNSQNISFVAKIRWKEVIIQEICDNSKNNSIEKKLNIYKNKLPKKVVLKLENIITKLSKEKLTKVYKKIEKIDLENKKYAKYKDILIYIKLRIWLELIKNKN